MICFRCGRGFSYRTKGWKRVAPNVLCPKCMGYKRQAKLLDFRRRVPKSKFKPTWNDVKLTRKLDGLLLK